MKKTRLITCAALALALAAPSARWANAQAASSRLAGANGMSAADRAVFRAHRQEVSEAAKIYGYDLATGKWAFEQAPCAAMPSTMLLRYHRTFPGGAESVFVAAVPRAEGRVRIVPVLYRNATPFVPAATNPRNVALFNELVPRAISRRDASAAGNWVELSACYAELTGGRIPPAPGSGQRIGIAGAPAPTIRLEPQGKALRVTLATRENATAYKLWNLSFHPSGQVASVTTSVTTEDQPVGSAEAARSFQPSGKAQLTASAAAAVSGKVAASSSAAEATTTEPGWKFVPQAPDPPSKIIPPAPEPSEITMPHL